jgi:hypothetical protein
MDIYLPADFHELHDAASEDWRDVSATRTERSAAMDPPCDRSPLDAVNDCADPLWRVF